MKETFRIGLAVLALGLVSLWVSFPSTEHGFRSPVRNGRA